jgi:lysophospholipase L1-like esterase
MKLPPAHLLSRLPPLVTFGLLILVLLLLWTITRPGIFSSALFSSSPTQPSTTFFAPSPTPLPTSTPSPTPTPFTTYQPPQLPDKPAYTVILVGDSMIKDLGPNGDRLRGYLSNYYPDKVFGIFNYAFSASNISSLQQRLEQDSTDNGTAYPSILNRQFDIIIIESFAYNPLSHLPLEQGLDQHSKSLYQAVTSIITSHPDSIIIFLATIKPDQDNFGQGALDLSPEARSQWARERISYLENHIAFAQKYSIPLINVYQASQIPTGQADPQFINSNDHIHPSVAGIELTASKITEFISQNRIIPKRE